MRISLFQLFLHFSVGSAPPAGLEMDIIVEDTCTVKEVKGSLYFRTVIKCRQYVYLIVYFGFLVFDGNAGCGQIGW